MRTECNDKEGKAMKFPSFFMKLWMCSIIVKKKS